METKICSKCGKEKSLEEFPFRDKEKGTRRASCKECHAAQVKARYYENKKEIDQTKENKSCEKCGYNKCIEALDYHHINPSEKENTVARLGTHYNIKKAREEIKKCVLLCANCHREFHYLERTQGIKLEDFLS